MKLVLKGTFKPDYDTTTVELRSGPIKYMLAALQTEEGDLPITIWGEKKVTIAKNIIEDGKPVELVVAMKSKISTYTNHEGETVTVPTITLNLCTFLVNVAGKLAPKTATAPSTPTSPYHSFIAGMTDLYPTPSDLENVYRRKASSTLKVEPWPTPKKEESAS